MKISYSKTNIPASVLNLCALRKVDVEKVTQAIESVLNGAAKNIDGATFGGLRRVSKGVHDIVGEIVARMPDGTVKQAVQYFADVSRLEKRAAKVNGVITLSDFPADLAEWFGKFAKAEANQPAKPKTVKPKTEAKAQEPAKVPTPAVQVPA